MQQPYLFISHSSQDEEPTEYIAARLREAGYRCWVDVASIPDGSSWLREIESGVDACAAMIVIMTAHGRASRWVEAETLKAIELRKPIFVARFDDSPLPIQLINVQVSDFRRRREATMSRLLGFLPTQINNAAGDGKNAQTSAEPNRHNFFKYLEQLPGGVDNSRIALDLYKFGKASADAVTFGGRSQPAFTAHVEIDMGGVVLFILHAYPKQPAVEVPLLFYMKFPPYDSLETRLALLEKLNAFLPERRQLDESRADLRPSIPLTALKGEKLEQFKGLLTEIMVTLRHGG
jgi:hypothetical protein